MTATAPVPFWLPPRTGVALDATLSPRVAFRFWSRAGLSLGGRLAVPIMQSGEVFASGDGDLQTVRQDTGMLLSVGGHPDLGVAFGGHLSFDVFF
jgi:hypothetical protein